MSVDLRFSDALVNTHPPVDLLFGADTGHRTLSFAGNLPPPAGVVALDVPALPLTFAGTLAPPAGPVTLFYDVDLPQYTQRRCGAPWVDGLRVRPLPTGTRWRDATQVRARLGTAWRDAGRLQGLRRIVWHEADRRATAKRLPWRDSALAPPVSVTLPWHSASRIAPRPTAAPWRDGAALRPNGSRIPWRDAAALRPPVTGLPWRDGRRSGVSRAIPWREGRLAEVFDRLPWRDGLLVETHGGNPFPPVVEPPYDPCYIPPPGGAVDLVLADLLDGSTSLLFLCDRHGATLYIREKRVYMTVHSLEVVTLPDLTPVDVTSLELSSDDGSFGWTMQAGGPARLLEQLSPVGGAPIQLRVTIDGIVFVFAVEGLRRDRAFGRTTASITGRSVTALLGGTYMPESTWLSTATATAQQLAESSLEYTGVTLDWQITDWLVPAGAWSGRGTPLAAVSRIADAAGAVLQSHRSDPQLVLLPRYPALPWEWATTTPDVQISLAAAAADSFERADQPLYDGVYISGESQGILAFVKITGTAGALTAPMVTDALITEEPAGRQRGRAILGATGPQARIGIALPVLTGPSEPGVLAVGQLVEIVEPAETWRGMVRAVSVSVDLPVIRQTIAVERHL